VDVNGATEPDAELSGAEVRRALDTLDRLLLVRRIDDVRRTLGVEPDLRRHS